jgi:hypothetical protein
MPNIIHPPILKPKGISNAEASRSAQNANQLLQSPKQALE